MLARKEVTWLQRDQDTLSSVDGSLCLIRAYVRNTLSPCRSSFKDNLIGTLGPNVMPYPYYRYCLLLFSFFTPLLPAQHNIAAITGFG